MERGPVIALGFAVAVILLAIVATRLIASRSRRRERQDLDASARDGEAAATWIGIRSAGGDDGGQD